MLEKSGLTNNLEKALISGVCRTVFRNLLNNYEKMSECYMCAACVESRGAEET